ncbi:MAG: hypothetical protein Q8O97_01055 [bacterium]|nr:hypothetical protein [bacterium]
MKTALELTAGVDSFTLLDLVRKAAAHKGLRYREGGVEACSEPFKTHELDDRLLAVLAECGIKKQDRPDCRHEIITLLDENPQEVDLGPKPSNYWNFRLLKGDERKFDLRVTLSVGFGIDLEKRGIVFVSQASGPYVSAMDLSSNLRMFKALVGSDDSSDVLAVAKELAASDGTIVVTWTELGLGGIRKLSHLFKEFAAGNETIARLWRSREVFDPVPSPNYERLGDELFIAEPAQPKVFEAWRAQLAEYRDQLVA